MKWRYRFILPRPEMIHHIATRYGGVAPGRELVHVAQYLHDCMRDPGLFGGLEPSIPPTSMAMKLYMTWTSRIGEFLALVWTDNSITESRSIALTKWAARTMFPGVPIAIREDLQSRIAGQVRELSVVNALLRAGSVKPHPRVASSLRMLSKMLGISERRYEQLVVEVTAHATK